MPQLKYQVRQTIYDGKSMLDETNFYNQRQGKPSELTRKLTYILGDYTKQFPLSSMTIGSIGYDKNTKNTVVELDDPQYHYPVMGKLFKASITCRTDYGSGDKPGIGNSEFFLYFSDNLIKRFYIIRSGRGTEAYVRKDLEEVSTGVWRATVVLDPAGPEDSCPLADCEAGASWIGMYTAVAESESRSTETSMSMPGNYKNQMGFFRGGVSWAGNASEKVMNITVKTDKGETNVWMDFFMWQFEIDWNMQREHAFWYSKYNRAVDGTIALKDLITGKVIPRGAGLLEQIENRTTYSKLTYKSLQNKIGDALYGHSDTDGMNITLYTGKGGMREIDRIMKEEGVKFLQNFGDVADKFVTGTNRELMLGGFFNGFYHIDGYTIKVKYNPLFDNGKVAEAQLAGGVIHPDTGFPLESYRMVFIDDNDYDGMPNITHVAQKGRAFLHGVVAGLTKMPKSMQMLAQSFNLDNEAQAALISTDVDKSSYTRMSSGGVCLRRGNRCFDLQCVAGL